MKIDTCNDVVSAGKLGVENDNNMVIKTNKCNFSNEELLNNVS